MSWMAARGGGGGGGGAVVVEQDQDLWRLAGRQEG